MSTFYMMLVDPDVTIEDAEQVKERVLACLREKGLITGDANEDCVSGGVGFWPGPACQDLYKPAEHPYEFWNMRPCGVEPRVGRDFNCWALGPSFEDATCPACGARFDEDGDDVTGILIDAVVESVRQTGPALVRCPRCAQEASIDEWKCNPDPGIGNLAFTFWYWPPLDSPDWRINIPDLVREVTGHRMIYTYGRF
jgi:hypothetical protein